MKTYYTVITQFLNGTVTMHTDIASFTSMELAEKVKNKIIEVNEGKSPFATYSRIEETHVYEDESEVGILNKENDKELDF